MEEFTVEVCNRAVDEIIHRDKLVHKIPHFLVRSMEDVRAVDVDINPILSLRADATTDDIFLLDD